MRFVKLFFLICLVLPGVELAAQGHPLRAGVFVNAYDLEHSKIGGGVSLEVARFHFDISSNFAFGEGRSDLRSTSNTYLLDKKRAGVINAGYIFRFSRFSVIPKAGVGWTFDIWQTPDPKPTYYLYNEKNFLNLGLIVDYRINDRLGIQVSGGHFERLSLGFNYYLGNI